MVGKRLEKTFLPLFLQLIVDPRVRDGTSNRPPSALKMRGKWTGPKTTGARPLAWMSEAVLTASFRMYVCHGLKSQVNFMWKVVGMLFKI